MNARPPAFAKTVGRGLLRPHKSDGLRDLFFQFSEEVEGVEGFELVEVGAAELFQDGTVERGEENFLVSVAAVRWRRGGTC